MQIIQDHIIQMIFFSCFFFFQKTNLATESPITIFHLNDIISNKMLEIWRTLWITATICAAVPKLLSIRVFAISTQKVLILYCETMSINRTNLKQLVQENANVIRASTVMHQYTHHGRYANSMLICINASQRIVLTIKIQCNNQYRYSLLELL